MAQQKISYNILSGEQGNIYSSIDKTINYDQDFTNHVLWLLEQLLISIKYNLNPISEQKINVSIFPKLDIILLLNLLENLFEKILNIEDSQKISFDVGQINLNNKTGYDLLNESKVHLKKLKFQGDLILFQIHINNIFLKFDIIYQLYLKIVLLEVEKNQEVYENSL